jgi:hypothetical protein
VEGVDGMGCLGSDPLADRSPRGRDGMTSAGCVVPGEEIGFVFPRRRVPRVVLNPWGFGPASTSRVVFNPWHPEPGRVRRGASQIGFVFPRRTPGPTTFRATPGSATAAGTRVRGGVATRRRFSPNKANFGPSRTPGRPAVTTQALGNKLSAKTAIEDRRDPGLGEVARKFANVGRPPCDAGRLQPVRRRPRRGCPAEDKSGHPGPGGFGDTAPRTKPIFAFAWEAGGPGGFLQAHFRQGFMDFTTKHPAPVAYREDARRFANAGRTPGARGRL